MALTPPEARAKGLVAPLLEPALPAPSPSQPLPAAVGLTIAPRLAYRVPTAYTVQGAPITAAAAAPTRAISLRA